MLLIFDFTLWINLIRIGLSNVQNHVVLCAVSDLDFSLVLFDNPTK